LIERLADDVSKALFEFFTDVAETHWVELIGRSSSYDGSSALKDLFVAQYYAFSESQITAKSLKLEFSEILVQDKDSALKAAELVRIGKTMKATDKALRDTWPRLLADLHVSY
jgi:hypothetical protein